MLAAPPILLRLQPSPGGATPQTDSVSFPREPLTLIVRLAGRTTQRNGKGLVEGRGYGRGGGGGEAEGRQAALGDLAGKTAPKCAGEHPE